MQHHERPEPALVSAILEAVDHLHGEQIAFLTRLVQCSSLRGAEDGAQLLVEDELARRGYGVTRVPTCRIAHDARFSPGEIDYSRTWNLLARRHEGGNGRSLILNAHVDVVPEGPADRWTHAPFGGTVEGDWMYGRGAGDMKAGLAAIVFALDALERAGVQPAGQVQIHAVVEEEITGNGSASLLAQGHMADAVLIPEPTDEQLVRANSGVIKFRVTLQGSPAHPREPESGHSAIDLAVYLATRLKELEARWNAERVDHPGFEGFSNPAALTIGTISGGEWIASLPASCAFEGRVGFYPGDLPAERQREFERFVAHVADTSDEFRGCRPPLVEWVGVCQPGYLLAPGGTAEVALDVAQRMAVETNSALRDFVMPCYLDSTLYANYAGIPSLVYGPIVQNIHGFDERVSLSSLARVTKTIALFIAMWCGVRRETP